MDASSSGNEALCDRIRQLEQEKDELHKEIEKLCMQQAGPDYIAVATQMHFRRTAGLEQEIENLKKKLASGAKENLDLQKEIYEAKRIYADLDRLHKLEVTKNTEMVKQLEHLHGIIATVSAERDHAVLEAGKAKENQDLMSQKVNDAEKRLQELSFGSIETQERLMSLWSKLEKQEQETEIFRKIIDKFYEIRQHGCRVVQEKEGGQDNQSDNSSWDYKSACLYNDPPEVWSFNAPLEPSIANYIAALEEQLVTLRCSVDDHRDKLERILSNKLITDGMSSLRKSHAQQRVLVMDLLEDGKSHLEKIALGIQEKLGDLSTENASAEVTQATSSVLSVVQPANPSTSIAQALQEKQEERHLLEVRNSLRGTLNELQRNLKQVTEEKVDALMKLAQVKQEYQLLLEKSIQEKQGSLTNAGNRSIVVTGRDGSLKELLKKTSLKRWFSAKEKLPSAADSQVRSISRSRSDLNTDAARLQIQNATLKDYMQSLKCLTDNIHKLRLSLLQAMGTPPSESTSRLLSDIICEAELVKNALGSPFSSGEVGYVIAEDHEGSDLFEKMDSVSAAGLEMVQLLILAALIVKEKLAK